MGAESDYTCLVWSLPEGEDPDSAYSSVPYEKVSEWVVILIHEDGLVVSYHLMIELSDDDGVVMIDNI